ncbi:hypothetical protein K439DRAFT_1638313 [Ramaria rubella]|nr:hypothetical protein K439DRAFT_1638313 [Ramaria rubella]
MEFISLLSDIVTLRKDLVDATPYLPSYDRGKCEQQIKVLEEFISRHRIPKSKFAFKRKPISIAQATTVEVLSKSSPLTRPAEIKTISSTSNLTLSSRSSTQLTLSSLIRPADIPSSEATTPASLPRSSDITLTDLRECLVNLFPPRTSANVVDKIEPALTITALHAKQLQRVVLLIPPIEGSVLVHDVHNSIVVVGCHQFRMHDSTNTTVLLHVLSNPIIERSQDIRFGSYPNPLRHTFSKSFQQRPSKHGMPQDFDWIKPSPSPNWTVLDSSLPWENRLIQMFDEKTDSETVGILDEVLQSGASP